MAGKLGDVAFKAFSAGLGVATLYLTVTFSINVYRGLAWHNAQSKIDKEEVQDQTRVMRPCHTCIVSPEGSL